MRVETERLIIRTYDLKDSTDALEYLGNEETMYYLPEECFDEKSVVAFIEKQKVKSEYFAIELKETGKVIGHLYFTAFFGNHSYEIGWVFNSLYWNKGYATEASKELINYGFVHLGLHRIIATCQPENVGSYAVMEKLGMRREGYFKKCIPVGNEWWDEYYYAILDEEWSELPQNQQ